ncbi:MAG: DUF433 domain-containing protein [Cellulomonadaceae bacterium]|nr:DUF433 domain-containing protein [Cellulomonadaceae bacterium]
MALRSVVRLRKHTSLQKIRQALYALPEFDLTDHPSQYQLATDGASVAVWTDDGFLDLIKNKGATELFTLADIYRPFQTRGGTPVADFRKPRPHLQVDAGRQGGWPTIEGTRITYDTVAWAIDGDSVTVENVSRFYPKVTPAAAMDAVSFAQDVDSRRQNRQQVAA